MDVAARRPSEPSRPRIGLRASSSRTEKDDELYEAVDADKLAHKLQCRCIEDARLSAYQMLRWSEEGQVIGYTRRVYPTITHG